MKTIKDAVIELGGKLEVFETAGYMILGDVLYRRVSEGKLTKVCTTSEFQSTAKRMGYINGYRWGIEYPTNGKRPELADDVLVAYQHETMGGLCFDSDRVEDVGWLSVVSFKVTDPRYKPADEVSEAERFGIVQPMNKNERCSMQDKESNWHERGELPPVGEMVEYQQNREEKRFEKCRVLAHHGVTVVFTLDGLPNSVFTGQMTTHLFRPIRTHREKVIEAVDSLIHDYQAGAEIRTELLNVLYDAGMLVLPKDSSDTE